MNKNNLILLKNNIIGTIFFSIMFIISLVICCCGWAKLFVIHVNDNDFLYEFLESKDYLIWDDSVGQWYTHYYSDVIGIIGIIAMIIFYLFALLFKLLSWKYSKLVILDKKYSERKYHLKNLIKWNFIFGFICGILILSMVSTLIGYKKVKLQNNELLQKNN